MRRKKRSGLFDTGKPNPRLARVISIESPTAFRKSVATLRKGGLTGTEKQALVLAQNRARAQLKRKNLSPKERRQFRAIAAIKLPRVTRK